MNNSLIRFVPGVLPPDEQNDQIAEDFIFWGLIKQLANTGKIVNNYHNPIPLGVRKCSRKQFKTSNESQGGHSGRLLADEYRDINFNPALKESVQAVAEGFRLIHEILPIRYTPGWNDGLREQRDLREDELVRAAW